MSKAGSTPTFAGPSCVRLVKAPALRRLPSGLLVEHARGRRRQAAPCTCSVAGDVAYTLPSRSWIRPARI
jgi:hypothetical protein